MNHESSLYRDIQATLTERMEMLTHRLSAIQSDRRQRGGPLPADSQEQATALENDEVLTQLDEVSRGEITQLGEALGRLKAGVYGQCAGCDEPIGIRRLNALPYTTLCVECAADQEG